MQQSTKEDMLLKITMRVSYTKTNRIKILYSPVLGDILLMYNTRNIRGRETTFVYQTLLSSFFLKEYDKDSLDQIKQILGDIHFKCCRDDSGPGVNLYINKKTLNKFYDVPFIKDSIKVSLKRDIMHFWISDFSVIPLLPKVEYTTDKETEEEQRKIFDEQIHDIIEEDIKINEERELNDKSICPCSII